MSLDYGTGGTKKKGRNLKKVVIAEVEPGPDGRKCPFHFGIRTYFHNIVEPQEKEVIETVDFLEFMSMKRTTRAARRQDDWAEQVEATAPRRRGSAPVQFLLTPPGVFDMEEDDWRIYQKRLDKCFVLNAFDGSKKESDYGDREKRGCRWEKACKWCGIPLLLIGVVAVLIGQLSPPREVIYRRGQVTYLDRKAITYNHRLQVCQLAGLAALCTAALMILLSFLIAAYSCPNVSSTGQEYCPVLSTADRGIPLSGVLTTVQPPSTPVHTRR